MTITPTGRELTEMAKIGSYVVSPDIYWYETLYGKIYIKERINDQTTICSGGSLVTPRI